MEAEQARLVPLRLGEQERIAVVQCLADKISAENVDRITEPLEALNRFLVRYAFQNQQAAASQTYVALMGDEVVGFYTLVVAQVEYDAHRNVSERDSPNIQSR